MSRLLPAAIRTYRARFNYKSGRIWRRHFRMPVYRFLGWWIVWVSLALAAGSYYFGLLLLSDNPSALFMKPGDLLSGGFVREYHVNILVELVGLFLALEIVWLLIERHSQQQADRIRSGVKGRIHQLRNIAALPITHTTTAVFDVPRFDDSGSGGVFHVRDNYQDIAEMLDRQVPEEFMGRDVGRWFWIMESYESVASMCNQTIRLYGPGLAEFPELLTALEKIESGVEREKRQWAKIQESQEERRNNRRDEVRRNMATGTAIEPPSLDANELPPEAIKNFLTLARQNLKLVVEISRILNDWDEMPPSTDTTFNPDTFWIWTYTTP